MTTYNIFEPWKTLDPWQKEYIETEMNCFLLCGRQSGKTAAASIKFGKRAATKPNQIILMIAYTEKQAYALFFKTLMYIKAVYPKMLITSGPKKHTKHVINLKNGSQIMCYAAGLDGTGIRTFTVTSLVIDEAAPMAREVFTSVTPMLSVTGGTLDILSTPRGREGYFFDCSDEAPKVRKNFKRFYVNAEDCPRHSKEFLADEKEAMTELEYAQEYRAMFLDDIKQFFSDMIIKSSTRLKEIQREGMPFLGVDVARKGGDEIVLASLDRINRKSLRMFDLDVTKEKMLTETTRRILFKDKEYHYKKIYIDDGGLGVGVFDPLLEHKQTKRKVVAINNASRSIDSDRTKRLMKEDLYFNFKNLMEKGQIELFDNKELQQSLKSIQIEDKDGKIRIHGRYSHIVEALVRAAWCIKDKKLRVFIN